MSSVRSIRSEAPSEAPSLLTYPKLSADSGDPFLQGVWLSRALPSSDTKVITEARIKYAREETSADLQSPLLLWVPIMVRCTMAPNKGVLSNRTEGLTGQQDGGDRDFMFYFLWFG